MYKIVGKDHTCCDRLRRRSFLQVGALGLGGITLPQLLAHRAHANHEDVALRKKSVIYCELGGGPDQFATYDPKPDAPSEYRGAFDVISTKLPGVEFSELMVRQAQVADKLAIVRSIHHENSSHKSASHYVQTGYYLTDPNYDWNEMPCIGSVVSRVIATKRRGVPAYVSLREPMRYGKAAYLGEANNPFQIAGNPNEKDFHVDNLDLVEGIDANRLGYRRALLSQLDARRRIVDGMGVVDALDQFTLEAFEMLTNQRVQVAFAIDQEPPEVRDRYGRHQWGQFFLLARRLIEAGVPFVSNSVFGWDHHKHIEKGMRAKGPPFDQGMAALVEDLYQRGLDRDVLVVAMGEFGRTPKINPNAGRDHWGSLMSVALSGGGLKVGQVVGKSNPKGEEPMDAPYRPEDVLAMVYRHLGISVEMTFPDFGGRPRLLLEKQRLIQELI